MASGLFNDARQAFLKGIIDWEDDNIDVLLVDENYTFDATHQHVDDVSANELTATDYVRKDLASRTVEGTTTSQASCANVTWAGLGGVTNKTIGGAIPFVNSGADSTSTVICFVDTGDTLTQDLDVVLSFQNGIVFTWAG